LDARLVRWLDAVSTPDVQGFIAASQQLRQNFGSIATFSLPVSPVWPDDTAINPDTGAPYDAMVVRSNASYTTVDLTVLVIVKQGSPLRPQSDTEWEPAGDLSGMDIILDIDALDYASVQEATEFAINDLNYKLEEWKPFSMANDMYRYLCYGRER
jgi:hypothetical protein